MEIIKSNVTQHQTNQMAATFSSGESSGWKLFAQPKVYKPFSMLIILFFLQQISGPYVIIFYAIELFVKIGGKFGEYINEYGAMLLLGILRFIMSILCAM